MEIAITGSLGRISKHIAQILLGQGHSVTVISSDARKQSTIAQMDATAAIGSIDDVAFLTQTFTGKDVVYLMEPPIDFFDHAIDMNALWKGWAHNYREAVERSGVLKVVHLSSIGAHTDQGNGMLAAHYHVEQILKSLPETVSISTLRPVGFYYNMFGFIPTIQHTGKIIQNYKPAYAEPWVAPQDIAVVAAAELVSHFSGRKLRYIASDEKTGDEIAQILGDAIGQPDLEWVAIPDEQMLQQLLSVGMSPQSANGLVEMNAARQTGTLFAHYFEHRPELGPTKIVDFAPEFAAAFSR